jgi:sugar O-acyltransferase (sialic acid O-acetyltransferase NeuD family)
MPRGVVILGTHVFAEEVADLVADCDDLELCAFVENWDRSRCEESLLGRQVFWIDDVDDLIEHAAICAIGSTRRRMFVEQAARAGFRFATLRHPSSVIAQRATVGQGSIVGAGVIVGSHASIGEHVIVNRGTLIGHHTEVGAFTTVSPGANIAGCITIGEGAFIGMGAVILDRVTIGAHALVAAGSLVTKDVPDRVEVRGAPARIVREGVEGR